MNSPSPRGLSGTHTQTLGDTYPFASSPQKKLFTFFSSRYPRPNYSLLFFFCLGSTWMHCRSLLCCCLTTSNSMNSRPLQRPFTPIQAIDRGVKTAKHPTKGQKKKNKLVKILIAIIQFRLDQFSRRPKTASTNVPRSSLSQESLLCKEVSNRGRKLS